MQFANAATLASELKEVRDGYQLCRLEKGIATNDLLLIDELSYVRFNQEESELIFKVLSERSERASTITTTNLVFSNLILMLDCVGIPTEMGLARTS